MKQQLWLTEVDRELLTVALTFLHNEAKGGVMVQADVWCRVFTQRRCKEMMARLNVSKVDPIPTPESKP